MKNLTLCDRTVRINDDGMVSLTDMWRASGQANKSRPKYFLENDKTKAFIEALSAKGGNPPLMTVKGGSQESGTWAHKLVAYKYASWIDPIFEVGAYTVLDKFFAGELEHKEPDWQALHDFVLDERFSRKLGKFHGKGLAQRRVDLLKLKERHVQLLKEFQYQLELTCS